jgi:AmmeMemoRadiSam system protein A
MSSLAEREKKLLLGLARRSLTAAAANLPSVREIPSEVESIAAGEPGGAFVTLFQNKRLRGCIGQLPGTDSLANVVVHCARAVATEDPRFSRVQPDELPLIDIEISVLSPLKEIQPLEIEVGKHGLLVARGAQRGVLLPQVAMQFRWNVQRFLEATCEKAGLPSNAWQMPGTRIQAFTCEIFSEAGCEGA